MTTNVYLAEGALLGLSSDSQDGTQRLVLGTYERAVAPTHYGEVIRLRWLAEDAKPAIAWQDASGVSKAWVQAHMYLGPGATNLHQHLGIETSKADGSIHTRMSFPFDQDRILIETSDSDFMVGAGYLGVSHDSTGNADLNFSEQAGSSSYPKRWVLRRDNATKSGGSAGQNFRLDRYDDSGVVIDTVISFERQRGNISLWKSVASADYGGGARVMFVRDRTTAPTSNPSGGGILYSESGALKWRGSSGTVTTIAPA